MLLAKGKPHKKILFIAACVIGFGQDGLASDIPTTNWGAVLKVPLSKVGSVEKGLVELGNWIKETHPMGDEALGLDSLTITKEILLVITYIM